MRAATMLMRSVWSITPKGTFHIPSHSPPVRIAGVYAPDASTLTFARRKTSSSEVPSVPSPPSNEDIWKAWQYGGLSVAAIAEKFKSTRQNVYQQILRAVEDGKPIDWLALCKEVDLNVAAADAVYKTLSRTSQDKAKIGAAMKRLPPKITREQTQLCTLMLERGLSIDDINSVISGQTGCSTGQTGLSGNGIERLHTISSELQKLRKIRKEFFRVSQGKKVILDQGLMDLLKERDGASLLEIAAIFSDCDQKQLVDLLYELEKAGNISSIDGKYHVVYAPRY